MTKFESVGGKPHSFIASGADVMTRFIIEYETTPHRTAATKFGWRAISRSGLAPAVSAAVGLGKLIIATTIEATTATMACAAKLAANTYGAQIPMVQFTSSGPRIPAKIPPAITNAIALGRKAGLAPSAAAKR